MVIIHDRVLSIHLLPPSSVFDLTTNYGGGWYRVFSFSKPAVGNLNQSLRFLKLGVSSWRLQLLLRKPSYCVFESIDYYLQVNCETCRSPLPLSSVPLLLTNMQPMLCRCTSVDCRWGSGQRLAAASRSAFLVWGLRARAAKWSLFKAAVEIHSPTVIPPSALDKPCIMKRYHRRQTCSHTSPRSPTVVRPKIHGYTGCKRTCAVELYCVFDQCMKQNVLSWAWVVR